MQKIYSLLLFLSVISYGQQGRVGINTDSPEATLDIREKPLDEMPEGYAQGVSFPNFTTKERKTFTEVLPIELKRRSEISFERECSQVEFTAWNGIRHRLYFDGRTILRN